MMTRLLIIVYCLLVTFHVAAQNKPVAPKKVTTTQKSTTAPKAATTQKQKTTPVKKPVAPVKTDKLYGLDGTTVLSGKVASVDQDSVSYYPASKPKVLKTIPASSLTKIVYADGRVKLIEAPKPEIKQEIAKEAVIAEPEKPVEPKVAPVVLDEITLKNGAVLSGRITSQQKLKVGYRLATDPDSGPEKFVSNNQVWKVKYGATGQEIVLNAPREKKEKSAEKTAKASKPAKSATEKPAKKAAEKPVKEKPVKEAASTENMRIFKPFKVDITTGYSRPSFEGVKAGFNLSLEPKYNITDHFAAGIKAEGVILVGVTDINNGEGTLSVLRSYSLTGEYYFGTRVVRPYAGISGGVYKAYSLNSDAEDLDDIEVSKEHFGFAPRLGVQIGQFRLGVEYNFVKDANFLSIKTGATIGGKRRKRPAR